jgi:intermediate filament protein if
MLEREREERRKALEEENTDLKQQLAKMHAEQSAITQELAQISDSKLTLELEIAGYRRLLEGEENKDGLKQIVDSMYSTMMSSQGQGHGGEGGSGMNVSQAVRGNITAKTTYQRSAKGPVNVGDCSPDGLFITLENTGRKDEPIGGYSIMRNTDGREMPGFTIPANTVIGAGQKIKLYARGKKGGDLTGIETNLDIWDTAGSVVVTKLCNPQGDDRANLTQRTVFN